eukprot:gene12978-16535_t
MNRRALLFAGLAVAAAAAAPARAAPAEIRVILVGGPDCPPCVRWKREYLEAWTASPEFRQVIWEEVEAARFREAYQEQYWPGALAPILKQIPRKSGAPRFLIVQAGRLVSNHLGVSKWANTLDDLRKLLG